MKLCFKQSNRAAILNLTVNEKEFGRSFSADGKEGLLTMAWNAGPDQWIKIDEVQFKYPSQTILPLVANQSFRFGKPDDIIAWQFNRDFYCIIDHDIEVSCAGFLFYGTTETLFVQIDHFEKQKFQALFKVFVDEMNIKDELQPEMLRMLLKRLIVKITRLAKLQYLHGKDLKQNKLLTIRQFNLLIERHFREEHQVQFYANQLNKSPKTLSNLFAIYNQRNPLQVIHERIILEAKRLFYYTDKSAKEVGYMLGFSDPAHFSHFFTRKTGQSPKNFKQCEKGISIGKKLQVGGH